MLGHAFEPMNAALFSFLDRLTADHGTVNLTHSIGMGGAA